jgi:hypothetical protein
MLATYHDDVLGRPYLWRRIWVFVNGTAVAMRDPSIGSAGVEDLVREVVALL